MFEKEHHLPNSHFGAHVKGVPHSLVPLLEKARTTYEWCLCPRNNRAKIGSVTAVMAFNDGLTGQSRIVGSGGWFGFTSSTQWWMRNTPYLLIVAHGFFIVNSDHIYMTLPLQQLFLFVSALCRWYAFRIHERKLATAVYLFQLCFALVGSRGPFIPVAVKWAFLQPIEIVEGLNIPKAQVKLKHTTGHSEA